MATLYAQRANSINPKEGTDGKPDSGKEAKLEKEVTENFAEARQYSQLAGAEDPWWQCQGSSGLCLLPDEALEDCRCREISRTGREARTGFQGNQSLERAVGPLQKDYPAAQKIFEDLRFKYPSFGFALANLALVLAESTEKANQDLALDLAQANINQNPRNADGYAVLGYVLIKQKKIKEAEEALRKAVSNGQASPTRLTSWGCCIREKGETKEALEVLEKVGTQGAIRFPPEALKLLEELKGKK